MLLCCIVVIIWLLSPKKLIKIYLKRVLGDGAKSKTCKFLLTISKPKFEAKAL